MRTETELFFGAHSMLFCVIVWFISHEYATSLENWMSAMTQRLTWDDFQYTCNIYAFPVPAEHRLRCVLA